MTRRKPIRHEVRSYTRKASGQTVRVNKYVRGSGMHQTSDSPVGRDARRMRARILSGKDATKYRNYVENSLHGELDVGKFTEPVNLKLVKVKASQLDALTSTRFDFEESVQFHIDEIRNGRTISPILVHMLPNGRYQVLDGNARAEAYRRLGIKEFPAVENGILRSIGEGAKKLGQYATIGAYKVAALGARGISKVAGGLQKVALIGEKAAPVVGKTLLVTGKAVGHAVGTGLAQAGAGAATYGAYRAELEGRTVFEGGKQQAMLAINAAKNRAIQNLLRDSYSNNLVRRNAARSALLHYYPNIYAIAGFGQTRPVYQSYDYRSPTENPV